MKLITTLFAIAALASAQPDITKLDTKSLIARARENPEDFAIIGTLAKRSDDPQVIPALRDAFTRDRISGAMLESETWSLLLSQLIAAYLFEKGVKDDIYFEEMARYANDAVAADPPAIAAQGTSGGEGGANINPAFEVWCGRRNLELRACRRQVGFYSNSLSLIRGLRDPRSIPILRSALKMSDLGMVGIAAAGLGLLNDVESLPLIAQACARFAPAEAQVIAIDAMDYRDAAVNGLFLRFIRDPEVLTNVREQWQPKHAAQPAPDKE